MTRMAWVALGLAVIGLGGTVAFGAMVGIDDDFWGLSIGQVDNSAQVSEPLGVFAGSLNMATVNDWLTAGGVHSFAMIPRAPEYYGNGSLPLAGVPNVGVQELTLTLSDWSTVTVPLTNAAYIKRGIAQGADREFYYDDMNFHDHESPHVIPANGGPRPVLYQVDLTAYQGQSLAIDPALDLRGNGYADSSSVKTFDAYEVTEAYDYTDVTYGSLVYGGEIPELPPLAFSVLATQDAMLIDGGDTPNGTETQHCVSSNPTQSKAMIIEFDIASSGAEGMEAAGDGALSVTVSWAQEPYQTLAVYELIGDEWDQTTVTAVNYCTDGIVNTVLGDMAGTALIENVGNFTRQEIPVAETTLTKLLNGDIRGLAISSPPGAWMNDCIRTIDASWTLHAEPTLIFSATHGGPPPPGDANGDGAVTDADYTIWADNYGASGATYAMGDFSGDGEVSDADYTLWADNYGAGVVGVPEPATMGLIALGSLLAIRRRK
jgi:PEP-CTERM motif-containing protein